MAVLHPFRALRPERLAGAAPAARIAAVPYDVVSTDEARALASGNPLSFLHVSRAEIGLPADTDPYSAAVYARAAANFRALCDALVIEAKPSVYLYRLQMGEHVQTGVAACFSIDEYDGDVIKKHERTRRDKEDDRTRHILELGAQTGPVFLTYRASADVNDVVGRAAAADPLFEFTADDGVRHTLWRASDADRDRLVAAFARIPAMYIADGHHRAASAARARQAIRGGSAAATTLGDGADFNTFLAVAFPHDQMQVLPYNRIVKDLGGRSAAAFMAAVEERFIVSDGPASPARRGEIAMFLDGRWRTLVPRTRPDASDPIAALDVSVLQDSLLGPVLNILDVRTDKRIDFVGGARGTAALEEAVRAGRAAVAFSMFPVNVADLMAVSDAGGIMPPKSTWFEPKLRDGLLSHLI
jgi:uncharacterized protein (DUF1015 family)